MIPKIIHYCWFGGGELGERERNCIDSWRRICPDYEILRWDESNYDVRKNKYMSDAYDEGMWAFVSDYARVEIVCEYGGLYFDTDVELIRSPDELLDCGLFCGWENRDVIAANAIGFSYDNSVNFGLGFGAVPNHPVLKDLLSLYERLSFYKEEGSLNLLACPVYQTEVLKRYGLDDAVATRQTLGDIEVYPEEWFSPKSQLTGQIRLTENTVSIHHFSMTWQSPVMRHLQRVEWGLIDIFGFLAGHRLARVVSFPFRVLRKFLGSIDDK